LDRGGRVGDLVERIRLGPVTSRSVRVAKLDSDYFDE